MDRPKFRIPYEKIPFIGNSLGYLSLTRKSLKHHRKNRDHKQLEDMAIPTTEEIELHCIWISEVYTPANINNLLHALKRLKWDRDNLNNEGGLTNWVLHNRLLGGFSSWMNGGFIVPHGKNIFSYLSTTRQSNLPEGIEYVHLSIRNITSSLTVVTLQFVLEDKFSQILDKVLKANYETKIQHQWEGFRLSRTSFIDIRQQMQEQAQEKVKDIHLVLNKWIKDNLPGHFSNSDGNRLPTINLLTSKEYDSTNLQDNRRYDNYLNTLFAPSSDIWKCSNFEDLELRWTGSSSTFYESKRDLWLFGNYEKLSKISETQNVTVKSALIQELDMIIDKTTALWATHNLLLSYESLLSEMRDQLTVSNSNTKKALENLDYIRKHFLELNIVSQIVINDIEKIIDNYKYDGVNFNSPYTNDASNFLEQLQFQDKRIIERLNQLQPQIREAILTSGNIMSAISNLNLQRSALFLTLIAIFLTLVSLKGEITNLWQFFVTQLP